MARPLIRTLNRLYAKLKGLAITETPLPTIQQNENVNTDLDLHMAYAFGTSDEMFASGLKTIEDEDLTLTPSPDMQRHEVTERAQMVQSVLS